MILLWRKTKNRVAASAKAPEGLIAFNFSDRTQYTKSGISIRHAKPTQKKSTCKRALWLTQVFILPQGFIPNYVKCFDDLLL